MQIEQLEGLTIVKVLSGYSDRRINYRNYLRCRKRTYSILDESKRLPEKD